MTTAIAEYSRTEAALAELRTKYSKKYDVTTTAGMSEARSARAEIKKYRTDLEKMRTEIKAPALERCRLIDAEAKRITSELAALEDPIDETIKAEEVRKEAEKIATENAKRDAERQALAICDQMRASLTWAVGRSPEAIAECIAGLAGVRAPENEYAENVELVRGQVKEQLAALLARAKEQEAEQKRIAAERVELERLRADSAKQESERLARAEAEKKKADAERAAADAKAKAERDAADAASAKARAEAERQARETREKEEARLRAEREKLDAERASVEAKARADREVAEAKARAEEERRQKKLGGRALLEDFCRRYGSDDDYAEIAAVIREWLVPAKKAKGAA